MKYANFHQLDHSQNSVFSKNNLHLYEPSYTPILIRNLLLKNGIELNTADVNIDRQILFNLYSDGQKLPLQEGLNYLLAVENPFITPLNSDTEYLRKFDRVFTWNRNLLSQPNTTQIFLPNKIKHNNFLAFNQRPIFSCLINSNKVFPFSLETDLYLERIKVIRWYEANSPEDFHLYGMGWDKPIKAYTAKDKFNRRIQRLRTQIFGYKPFPSFQGEIKNKSGVLEKAKFAYCFENVSELPDYITEKIFDCFFSGCVPIYWGSETIRDHIPTNCFINRRDFKNTNEVHQFLKSITEHEYSKYQESIKRYLLSSDAKKFDIENFSETIVEKIIDDLNIRKLI
ncbi:MAG: glycosyltransferase family 10 [Polynucleobacter sp.]